MDFLLSYKANRYPTSIYGYETSSTEKRNYDDSTQSSVLTDKSLDQNQFEEDLLLNSKRKETANFMESIPLSSKKKRNDLSELLQLHRENQKRQERIEFKEMLSSTKDENTFSCRWRKTVRNFPVTCKHE
ncbi:hypothetical protein HHI36_007828 [Cryptolaemus montrouzieri]|uniref:Uncharacterized protein n=1 Tax=Cryptolaemus montrouzieri TaxID=559131 RepID=A0ABD2MQL4_9CUCU